MKLRLIYIAGKIAAKTTWQREQYIRHAEEVALAILKMGAAVYCPHTMCRYFDGEMPWEEWIARDIEVLSRCNAIFMLPNWKDSKGATTEYEWAKKNEMKILHGLGEVAAYLKKPYSNDDMDASQLHKDPRRTAYVVKLEKQVLSYTRALEKLERLGWPCRLEELPDKYEELQKKLKERT